MPIFKQQPKGEKRRNKKEIPQEMIEEYKGYIEQLKRKNVGILEFGDDEDITLARKALLQAGEELKKYVKVRKPRGKENVLQFERITQREWMEIRRRILARSAKRKKRAAANV